MLDFDGGERRVVTLARGAEATASDSHRLFARTHEEILHQHNRSGPRSCAAFMPLDPSRFALVQFLHPIARRPQHIELWDGCFISMFSTIYGVDFSGAKLAGRNTWLEVLKDLLDIVPWESEPFMRGRHIVALALRV